MKKAILEFKEMKAEWFLMEPDQLVNTDKVKKAILIAGESRQADQEERKKMWQMMESEKERSGRNHFKKAWKRERLYNGYLSRRDFFEKADECELRVLRHETKGKTRPFLKVVLNESLGMRAPMSFGNQTQPLLSEPYVAEPQQAGS